MEPYLRTQYRIFLMETNSNSKIWEVVVDNVELLAGMLAASVGIIYDLNSELKFQEYYLDSNADVSYFRLLNNIIEDNVKISSEGRLREEQYGIWLRGSRAFHYSLYTFQTNFFFQGIISICNMFGVDFRNYIYGFPFDGNGKQYALANYSMAQYQIGQDAPDIDDVEEEEADDENIIEPLARTDDIITLKD